MILTTQEPGWYIAQVNKPTTAKNFKGETRLFDHYYRIYDAQGHAIKYCKFQQLDRLAAVLHKEIGELPIHESFEA